MYVYVFKGMIALNSMRWHRRNINSSEPFFLDQFAKETSAQINIISYYAKKY